MAGCFNTEVRISEYGLQELRKRLIKNEGMKIKLYKDSTGHSTIGVGRNLDDIGISEEEAIIMMDNDIEECIKNLSTLNFWHNLNETRKLILIEMCFNIGFDGIKGFKKMLSALELRNYNLAAKEMMDSLWAKQVKERAVNLSFLMREGDE